VHRILGIDHIAFTAADLEATCAFYDRLFGARTHLDYAPDGKSLVRQIALGGALLSIYQVGNGLALVARHPTVRGADMPALVRAYRDRNGPAADPRDPNHRWAVAAAHRRRA
jgi:catechol 2,3-dioxygenase-like lactoylglutathione lyase family enzyme